MAFETRLAPLAKMLRTGELSLGDYLEQLEAHFAPENERVLAFLPEAGRFKRLHRQAAELEAQYPNPDARPPLYGVPVGVKDIFHANNFATEAGSQLPAHILAGPEAKSVSQLKAAGALILGKTVTTEFAYFAPGPTRNPHNTEHTPGGSSSGSAAGVGAGMCPLTLGTQTVGSVIRPAAFCGTVGYKPTSGRISTKNVIPLSLTLDHVGIFTQDVAGATLAASVLVNEWQPVTGNVASPRLGVPVGPYLEKADAEGLAHFLATCQKLEAAGFATKEVEVMTNFDDIVTHHMDLTAAEAARFHEEWYADFGNRYHPKTVTLLERGAEISGYQLEAHRAFRHDFQAEINAVMAREGILMWITPAAPGPAPAGLDSTGDPVMNLPWTFAGLPAVNLPSGLAENGLPLGLQLVGNWQQDEQLLAWAEQIAAVLDD